MAKTITRSGDMTVYTTLLIVSAIVLLAGIGVLWMSNLSQADAAGVNDGMPFTVVK